MAELAFSVFKLFVLFSTCPTVSVMADILCYDVLRDRRVCSRLLLPAGVLKV